MWPDLYLDKNNYVERKWYEKSEEISDTSDDYTELYDHLHQKRDQS